MTDWLRGVLITVLEVKVFPKRERRGASRCCDGDSLPQPDSTIQPAGHDQLAIMAEGDSPDPAFFNLQGFTWRQRDIRVHRSAREESHIPEQYGGINAARGQDILLLTTCAAVGVGGSVRRTMKGDSRHPTLMFGEGQRPVSFALLLCFGDLPQAYLSVLAAGSHPAAVRAKSHGKDALGVVVVRF